MKRCRKFLPNSLRIVVIDRFDEMNLHSYVRTIPHYPRHGILFRDLTTLFLAPEAFSHAIGNLRDFYRDLGIQAVAGIEARGFILGAPLAVSLDVGFIAIRKSGKLPYDTVGRDYQLEYGTDRLEIHVDSVDVGQRILVVDDLLATGGTAHAAVQLLRDVGAVVDYAAFLVDLPELGGGDVLRAHDVVPHSLMSFPGH
jgi:adenine phosphoribosyltransferase